MDFQNIVFSIDTGLGDEILGTRYCEFYLIEFLFQIG